MRPAAAVAAAAAAAAAAVAGGEVAAGAAVAEQRCGSHGVTHAAAISHGRTPWWADTHTHTVGRTTPALKHGAACDGHGAACDRDEAGQRDAPFQKHHLRLYFHSKT